MILYLFNVVVAPKLVCHLEKLVNCLTSMITVSSCFVSSVTCLKFTAGKVSVILSKSKLDSSLVGLTALPCFLLT